VNKKYMVELIQQSQVSAITFERARPEFEKICHRDLATTAPILDAIEFNQALWTPGNKKEEVVVLLERDTLDRGHILQPKSLTKRIDQPVKIALDVVIVVIRQNGLQISS